MKGAYCPSLLQKASLNLTGIAHFGLRISFPQHRISLLNNFTSHLCYFNLTRCSLCGKWRAKWGQVNLGQCIGSDTNFWSHYRVSWSHSSLSPCPLLSISSPLYILATVEVINVMWLLACTTHNIISLFFLKQYGFSLPPEICLLPLRYETKV